MLRKSKPSKEKISVNGLDIELIRSARKSLSLEIGVKGIKARAPKEMAKPTIISFIKSKHAWLQQKLAEQPDLKAPFEFTDGAMLLYLGQPIVLRVLENQRGKARLIGSELNLPVVQSNCPLSDTIKRKLITWYKESARTHLSQRIAFYAPLMRVESSNSKQSKLTIREYKRRWGSCDQHGALSFNWRIIMAAQPMVDYVVIHELAHRREFNHSQHFWRLVADQMPNWQEKHDWLNTQGSLLYPF